MTRISARLATLLMVAATPFLGTPALAQDRDRDAFEAYEELLRLLKNTHQDPPATIDDRSPVAFVLHGAKLEGDAAEKVAHLTATFDVEVAKGWVVVPIGLAEASLDSVGETAGPRPGLAPMQVLLEGLSPKQREGLPSTGYGLLLQGPGRFTTALKFALPVTSQPGRSSFELTLPGAALNMLSVEFAQPGLRVSASNALASHAMASGSDATRLEATYGPGAKAQVVWNPRPKTAATVVGAPERDPLLFADTETSLRIDEGVVVTVTRVHYRVHQAPSGEFKLRFPKGYTLLGLKADDLRAYPTPQDVEGEQEVTLALRNKVFGTYSVEMRLERVLGEGDTEVAFPHIKTVGTERETGMLAARASEHLNLEPAKQSGLSQVDAKTLSKQQSADLGWNGKGQPPLAFRYLRQPYALALRTSAIEAEVEGRLFSLAMVKDDEVALATALRYTIRKRGIFAVRIRLPKDFQLLECGDERLVKDFRVEPASEADQQKGIGSVLSVDFNDQQGPGAVDLRIYGLLRRAPQAAGAAEVALPRFELLDVTKETAVIAVGAQQQLKLTLESKSGLLPLAVRELADLGFPHGSNRGEELIFAFRYAKPEGVAATFKIQRREPRLSARLESLVDAQEDRVRVSTTVHVTVQYAAIDTVRLRVPPDLGLPDALKFDGAGIKDTSVEVSEGKAIWTVALQGMRIGTFPITFSYDLKHTGLAAGQQRNVTLREVEVLDCFSETGDIALKKHENVVVDEFDRVGVEKRDKRELPQGLAKAGVVQAYRYVGHPYRLVLRVTKYDFKAPLGIQIRHLHVDQVVGKNGEVHVEATLALQNSSEQSLRVLLPAGVKPHIKVDGKRATPTVQAGAAGAAELQIHLGEVKKQRGEAPFQIRIRYDLPSPGKLSVTGLLDLDAPVFPLGADGQGRVPVAKLTRSLYLPSGYYYLSFDTEESKQWNAGGFWDELARELGLPSDATTTERRRGARGVRQAIQEIKRLAPRGSDVYYPKLVVPGSAPYLFESLEGQGAVSVRYLSGWLYYLLAILVLAGVVGAGVVLEQRKLVGPVHYTLGAAGLSVLGAIFLGDALRPFLGCSLVGSLGLGGVFMLRAVWRELTNVRAERGQERADVEARVAKERARAAEAEASLRQAPAEAEA